VTKAKWYKSGGCAVKKRVFPRLVDDDGSASDVRTRGAPKMSQPKRPLM